MATITVVGEKSQNVLKVVTPDDVMQFRTQLSKFKGDFNKVFKK
jgi:hypothetical protein